MSTRREELRAAGQTPKECLEAIRAYSAKELERKAKAKAEKKEERREFFAKRYPKPKPTKPKKRNKRKRKAERQRKEAFSAKLKKNMTPAEKALWKHLRHGVGGHECQPHAPVAGYFPDFLVPKAKLAIEVDGGYHDQPAQKKYDALRTEHLAEAGLEVVRFTNADVLKNTTAVFWKIDRLVRKATAGMAWGPSWKKKKCKEKD